MRDQSSTPDFLAGGGECGAHLRSLDWQGSSLGPVSGWPAALKLTIRLALNTAHPIFIFWAPELLCFYNDAYSQSLGPERHPGALGRPGREVWDEIWPIIGPQIDDVMAGRGATWHQDHLVPITRNGRREDVYWTYSYSPIDDERAAGGIGGVLVLCTETTERVLAGRRHAHERDLMRAMFEQAPSFMCLLRGPDHVFEHANSAYLSLIGGREVAGKTVREVFPDLEGQGLFEMLDKVRATGEPFRASRLPVKLTDPATGEVREQRLELVYQPVRDVTGEVSGIFVDGYDVTDSVRVEHELVDARAEAESRWREVEQIYAAAPIGLALLDRDLRFSRINERLAAMNGLSIAGHLGRTIHEVLAPDVAAQLVQVHARVMNGETVDNIEISGHHAVDHTLRTWLASYTPFRDRDGRITQMQCTVIEITERKQAEKALRDSEARLQLGVSVADFGLGMVDYLKGTVAFNARASEMFALPADTPVPRAQVHARFHPADASALLLLIEQQLGPDGDGFMAVEHRVLHPDGSVRWLNARKRIEYETGPDGERRPVGAMLAVRDITSEKLTERALRDSELRYRASLRVGRIGYWETNLAEGTRIWSQEGMDLFGIDAPGGVGKVGGPDDEWRARIHPDDRHIPPAIYEQLRVDDRLQTRYRVIRPDGAEVAMLGHAEVAERDANGRVTRLINVVADVTALTRVETALRESEARLASALAAGQIGVFDYDLSAGRLNWDVAMLRLWGLPEDEPATYEAAMARLHLDDVAMVAEALKEAADPDGPRRFAAECRVVDDDGSVRWLVANADTSFGTDGAPLRLVGTVRDVTDRKLTDEHRKVLLDELNHRVKNTLATVNAIASQTLRGSDVSQAARAAFEGRLMALAGAHDLLIAEHWTSARLMDIVDRALAPHVDRQSGRIEVVGPDALLDAKAALALTMCLHELATNASKYGALSNQQGRVSVRWRVDDGQLVLRWEESGGPVVSPPTRRGFGTRLIERVLGSDLNGRASIAFEPSGVICEISAAIRLHG